MALTADSNYMKMALDLALKGRGKTAPNPMVGAVIVKKGRIVGRGYHRAIGKEHAEVMALKQAGSQARGATLFVNLEPCCHIGRTGPCTEAIKEARIKRVVFSIKDPNPVVNGKGMRSLRKAGIEVEAGLLRHEARLLNDAYIGYHENKRPFVIVKIAQSLDGRIATSLGDSKWITSPASRRYAHQLRAQVDAVVVGSNTVKIDDPMLTVRHIKGQDPYRIVLSSTMGLPSGARLFKDNGDYRTIIATTERAVKQGSVHKGNPGAILWAVKSRRQHEIDLGDFIDKAYNFGLQSLLVEGGSSLVTSFLREGLVDKLVVITAPLIVGRGMESVGQLDIRSLTQALRFDQSFTFASGPDTVFVGYPKKERA
ncbi:MAG: bifunctional diaminohydroxyphosphoribosylaminopyrimidine deaminase/5-amino-6-(5-phosphoribosylamino)uracil reductase RibD [Candidatus Zixiibacteriota bacterium]